MITYDKKCDDIVDGCESFYLSGFVRIEFTGPKILIKRSHT